MACKPKEDEDMPVPEFAGTVEECAKHNNRAQDELYGDLQTSTALGYARTTAFIQLVYSENIRSYTARSFTDFVWVDMCANAAMQKAILFAQIMLYIFVLTPGLSTDIMLLHGIGIGGYGWAAALCGSFCTLLLCELYKFVCRAQVRAANIKLEKSIELAEREREAAFVKRQQELKAKKEAA